MSGNQQKTPLAQNLNRWGRQVSESAIQKLGKALPATIAKVIGNMITANYEITGTLKPPQVTMAPLMSRYLRYPLQNGDPGMTLPGDAFMGGMTGLGGGVADPTQRGNLATSTWHPVSNTDWPAVDPKQTTITGGPNGLLLRSDESGAATVLLTNTEISAACAGHTVVINGTGVIIDGKIFLLHEHINVQVGPDDTGPVA